MQHEAAGAVLDQQARGRELGERAAGLRPAEASQAGRRGQADVRTGMDAQQPEHARGRLGQLAVGPGEHRPDAGRLIAGVERVEPVLLVTASSPASAASDSPGLASARAAVMARASGSRAHSRMIWRTAAGSRSGPLRAEAGGEQRLGVLLGQQVQRHGARGLGRDQAGQR